MTSERHPYDMSTKPAYDTFLNSLRRALQHLYDPAELRRNPLFEWLGLPTSADRVAALRKTLQTAIQTLKPDPHVPSDSNAARIYEILAYRFIEQSSQKEVASDMALSTRQLQRLESSALETLGDHLIYHYQVDLERVDLSSQSVPANSDEDTVPADENAARLKIAQELAWLEHSTQFTEIDSLELIQDVLQIVAPGFQNEDSFIELQFPEPAPCISGDPTILRQAFLTLLSTLIHTCPDCHVKVSARSENDFVEVEIIALLPVNSPSPEIWRKDENDLLQQLIKLSGGELTIQGLEQEGFQAALRLPGVRCRSILALDDNTDALALLERYLSNSPYQITGFREPAQLITTAESMLPSAIILDVMVPGMDGWQVLGQLKANPQTRMIPVVVSTILPQESLAMMLGAEAFLRKPFTRKDLLALLDHLLQPGPE